MLYRTVIVLIISKVLERLIYDKVINLITLFITSLQYIQALRKPMCATQCLLWTKLWNIEITGSLWKWFNCYLSNRTQCVSVNNCLSNCLPVISGVPQGITLGPLLFLIFINDLPSVITSRMLKFAEDAKCFRQIISMSDILQLQLDFNSLFNWTLCNLFSF